MWPIKDLGGLEQGGVPSSDLYKSYNNSQLKTAQKSQLGVKVRSVTIPAIGLADDIALLSNSIISLLHLLYLTVEYCKQYYVDLVPEKTKFIVDYQTKFHPITLNNMKVPLSQEAEHVGILRSPDGNLPNIMERISAHNKAVNAVLPVGLAQRRHGNPASSLRLEQLYGLPVLMSGLGALILKKYEISLVENHHKNTLQRLMKLHEKTPSCVIFFLAG